MWLSKLQISIIEKNTVAIEMLLDEVPTISKKKDIDKAIYLLKETSKYIQTAQNETGISIRKMKKNISFLRSIEVQNSVKLDITS